MKSALAATVCFCVALRLAADEGAPSLRPLSGEDFASGIVLTKVGFGEEFDFSAPEGAEVCADWEAFGAARDWFRLGFGAEEDADEYAPESWSFAMGTNRVDSFTVFSYGTIRPSVTNVHTCISPLNAVIGIVPASNYGALEEANRPSRFWHCLTPSDTLLLTWQNVLLDRDVAKPVSFQAEIDRLGNITFRYDLSRLPEERAAGLSAGVVNEGRGRMFSCLPRDVTSLRWRRLDPSSPDSSDHDGDGVTTHDELFVYDTDPYSEDTDRDGLTDHEEIAEKKTNPTRRYSSDPRLPDSIASALDGEDPYSCPNRDGRTAFENVFYTGSPDGRGGEPVSGRSTAVLQVSAVGSGRGVLMAGDTMVPLLPGVNPLKVAVPRGGRIGLRCEIEGELYLNYDSPDFCIGEPPYGVRKRGWVLFPKVEATHPCIHTETCAVDVRLDPAEDDDDDEGFTCTWISDTEDVGVESYPPLSARLMLGFSRTSTSSVRYEIGHPKYLFGETSYSQVCEFCPKVRDDDGYSSTKDYEDREPTPYSDYVLDWCDAHICPKELCKHLHNYGGSEVDPPDMFPVNESVSNAYVKATNSSSRIEHVLKLHRPKGESEKYDSQMIHVDVPPDKFQCCSCKEHWASYASIGYKNHRVNVHYNGAPFDRTTEDCDLAVFGAAPSSEIGDSHVSILTNGAMYVERDYTVLGVSILADDVDLRKLNELNADFGMPVVINTNLDNAVKLKLCTDVNLQDGIVRLAFEKATTRMQLWMTYTVGGYYGHEKRIMILDSKTRPSQELSIKEWRSLVEKVTYNRETTLQLLAYGSGSARLFFGYAGGKDGKYLHDEAVQTITAIRPPLLPDYNRDGRIDDSDAKLACDRRFYFWTNKDCWKNDLAFSKSFYEQLKGLVYDTNGDDDQVNGRNDLVNQLPMAICTKGFLENWGRKNIEVVLMPSESQNSLRRCYGATSWDAVRSCVLEDIEIDDESSYWEFGYGSELHKAKLCKFNEGGDVLSTEVVRRSLNNKGMMYIEAFRECCNPITLLIRLDGETLFSYTPQIKFSNVEDMYRWHNIRSAADESAKVELESKPLPSPQGWPDSERDDANMYFVHGYNVSEREARTWGQAFFKRMWWSGMNAKFHVVAWFGNETQIGEKASPNYHVNVENAFASSKAFVDIVKKYPGRNYVAAHSLGNMLVSSAIQDWGLPYERYFMLNAAVAAEAYDASATTKETIHGMTPHSWDEVPNMYRSTHWYELEGFAPNDARRQLTWRNRFNRVNKAVNYYSSEEEVLQCDPSGGGKFVLQRDWAWYNQERIKGDNPVPGSRDEGGWAYNSKYQEPETGGDPRNGITTSYHDPSVSDILAIKEDLRCHPVFKPFEDASLLTANFVSSITREMISQLLADAIPAESFPAGFNEVPKWNVNNAGAENINMAKELKSATEIYFWSHDKRWGHSYLLDAPYMVVHGLFEDMKGKMK